MKDSIVVYTAITGGKDKPRSDILNIDTYNKFVYPVMNAKAPKILSHQFVDAEISVWIDGNIFLLIDKEKLVEEFLGESDMAVWKHFDRDCIYDELPSILGLGGDKGMYCEEQVDFYRKNCHPEHWGLGECNLIIRRHNVNIQCFNNDWWSEICRWSARDQLSFPVVLRRHPEIDCRFIEGNIRKHNYFKYEDHENPYTC